MAVLGSTPWQSTQLKPKGVAGDDVTKNIAESAQLKPADVAGDDLTKKIAESTQLKPKDVKRLLSALHTIAYIDLKRQSSFLMPGVHRRARKMRQEHGHWVITGNFKVVMVSA